MDKSRYRKHPRVYNKKHVEEEVRTLTFGSTAAAGILAGTFLCGALVGYVVKKVINDR